MFDDKEFDNFAKLMEDGIIENTKYYDNTWKTEDVSFLEHRLSAKYNEFIMTKKPSKLISLANLAMMLYIRYIKQKLE